MNKYIIFFLKETLHLTSKNIEKTLSNYDKSWESQTIGELVNRIYKLCSIKLAGNMKSIISDGASAENLFMMSCKEFDDIELAGVKIISIACKCYPDKLCSLSSRPSLLYCLGDCSLLNKMSIAVVGSRNASSAAGIVASRVSKYFSARNVTVVSGLALNIDSIAHESSFLNAGRTIAVVVDVINVYPQKNRELSRKIVSNNGLLLAENKPGVSVKPYHFISRDRIQSALSSAVFPIETCINGGTMHAVKAANKLEIPIFIPDYAKLGYEETSPQLAGMLEIEKRYFAKKFDKSNYDDILKKLQDD